MQEISPLVLVILLFLASFIIILLVVVAFRVVFPHSIRDHASKLLSPFRVLPLRFTLCASKELTTRELASTLLAISLRASITREIMLNSVPYWP